MEISSYTQTKLHTEKLDMAKKGNLERETESLLIATQNNSIRTNYIIGKIDDTQQRRLREDKNEMVNHKIYGCSKLVQKEYTTRHDWVGKVIHWKLCKKLKLDHTTSSVHLILYDWYRFAQTSISHRELDA